MWHYWRMERTLGSTGQAVQTCLGSFKPKGMGWTQQPGFQWSGDRIVSREISVELGKMESKKIVGRSKEQTIG